jgi:hypothetical protein
MGIIFENLETSGFSTGVFSSCSGKELCFEHGPELVCMAW